MVPPFRYVGHVDAEHADFYEYTREDGKTCTITGAMFAGMSVSVSCEGDITALFIQQKGFRYIGNVYQGKIYVYEYTRDDGHVCTYVSGHGDGTRTDIDC
ncbi:MAG: hypothetical protein UW64_C0015G0003 [Microgenomates group bacterium GW2011_GWC1_44_37]|nr:MAG: hypothetical protein UW64_C0015G0003 [Microgenomates group bacterium GW2011_GWC1_44_37]